MKKRSSLLIVGILCAFLMATTLCLAACENPFGGGTKLPKTAYEKVKYAFDGVAKSFANSRSSAEVEEGARYMSTLSNQDALNAIWEVYTSGDNMGNNLEGLDYDEPPMQQFQYLKAILEKVGKNYAFGTKYYDTISGKMYADLQTGSSKADAADKEGYDTDYTLTLALSIVIDANDQITADVSFDILLVQGSTRYNTQWYVGMVLDYDMTKSEPNYTMTMVTDNREADLVYLNRPQGYEYDYVEVKDGAIYEWRKFEYSTDRPLVEDATHSRFADYADEIEKYDVGNTKWYKNRELRKITQMTADKKATLAAAFYDGLGLNSTSIGGDAFLTKAGTKSSTIGNHYQDLCRLRGSDIIYDLVCDDEEGGKDTSWPDNLLYDVLGFRFPTPQAEGAAYMAETEQGEGYMAVRISTTDFDAQDWAQYAGLLEDYGFAYDEQQNCYMLIENDAITAVKFERNVLFFVKTYATQQGSTIDPIDIEDGYAFALADYSGYYRSDFASAKEAGQYIETLSHGAVTADSIREYFVDDNYIYYITLSKGDKTTQQVNEIVAAYRALYAGWATFPNSNVYYVTQKGRDVLISIEWEYSEGAAILQIAVFHFDEGSVATIANGQGQNQGQGQGHSQSDGGQGQGQGQGQGEGDPQGQDTIQYEVVVLQGTKEISRTSYDCAIGDTIEVNVYGTLVYMDSDCTNPAPLILNPEQGMVLYVQQGAPKGTFTLYDITDKGPAIAEQFECELGETACYGYSFEYVVYADVACTQMVPLDTQFEMTEDGIELYRKDKLIEDYVPLTLNCYINGYLSHQYTIGVRKGQILYNSNYWNWVEMSYFDANWTAYMDQGKTQPFELGGYMAFVTEGNIYSFAQNSDYHLYSLYSGETLLGERVMQATSDEATLANLLYESKGITGEFVSCVGYNIVIKNVRHDKCLKECYVYNGKVIRQETYYFQNEYYYIGDGASPYYSDAALTNNIPFQYMSEEEGTGFKVTTSTTIYTAFTR